MKKKCIKNIKAYEAKRFLLLEYYLYRRLPKQLKIYALILKLLRTCSVTLCLIMNA